MCIWDTNEFSPKDVSVMLNILVDNMRTMFLDVALDAFVVSSLP